MEEVMMPRKKSLRRRRFTLIEIVAVVVILGILAVAVINIAGREVIRAKISAAKGHIRQIEDAVQMFIMDNARYPEKLSDLVTEPTYASDWKKGGYLKVLSKDPWGINYFYKVPGPDDRPYVIGSYGADKKDGGEDDNADITCWNIYDEQDSE